MVARNIGAKAGKAAGWTAATLWKGVCYAAEGAGEAGQGFMAGAEEGWTERCAVMDAKVAANKAKVEAARAKLAQAKAEAALAAATTAQAS